MLCVGLDPDPARLPAPLNGAPDAIERFCRAIIDATADLACAFKPQIAYFSSQGEERALERICRYIRETYPDVTLILDAKRGDIGPTAEHWFGTDEIGRDSLVQIVSGLEVQRELRRSPGRKIPRKINCSICFVTATEIFSGVTRRKGIGSILIWSNHMTTPPVAASPAEENCTKNGRPRRAAHVNLPKRKGYSAG